MRTQAYTSVKTKQFYECERNNLCINPYTPHVAATSFFAGEVEIFDFVTERVKRCIAAKRGRGGGSLKTHNDGWNWNLIKCLGSIFYEHSVVVGNIFYVHKNGRRDVTRRYVLGDGQSECMFINWKGFMVYIFFIHNVVGGVVNCKSFIYGGRTSLFLSSQRMPAATSSDCEMIQLYEYIIVDKMA